MFPGEKHFKILHNAFEPLDLDLVRHEEFIQRWEEVSFQRHEFLTQAGNIERYFYVVIEGIQAVYILDKSGGIQVIGFSFDGSFSGIYDSFMKETPSNYFLETLSPSRLLRINLKDFNAVFDKYPEFEKWGRIVHLELLVGRVDREVELITKTAKERFKVFMERCPEPLKTIPQKYLASYLNMTPETFSRMRKEEVS